MTTAVDLDTALVTITAFGDPVPQGSIRSLGKGRPSIHSNAARLLPWRESVAWSARAAMATAGIAEPLSGPLRLSATFTVRKPASAPKRRRTWPQTRPDLDRTLRALGDALTAAGLWRDDSQVVEIDAAKRYPGEGTDALASPGVVVRVWALDGAP